MRELGVASERENVVNWMGETIKGIVARSKGQSNIGSTYNAFFNENSQGSG